MTPKTENSRFTPRQGTATRPNRSAGFTLIELAVALTIILMIVVMVVPTLTNMLASRSEMEAFNLIAAQLTAARSEAIGNDTYAGVHVQLGYDDGTGGVETEVKEYEMKNITYSMIVGIDPAEFDNDTPNLEF